MNLHNSKRRTNSRRYQIQHLLLTGTARCQGIYTVGYLPVYPLFDTSLPEDESAPKDDWPFTITVINMQKAFVAVLVIAIVFVIQISSQEIMLSPPSRPAEFRNPNELREYMKALNEYYAIVGRPRFGRSILTKRFGSSSSFNEALKSDESKE